MDIFGFDLEQLHRAYSRINVDEDDIYIVDHPEGFPERTDFFVSKSGMNRYTGFCKFEYKVLCDVIFYNLIHHSIIPHAADNSTHIADSSA